MMNNNTSTNINSNSDKLHHKKPENSPFYVKHEKLQSDVAKSGGGDDDDYNDDILSNTNNGKGKKSSENSIDTYRDNLEKIISTYEVYTLSHCISVCYATIVYTA